MRVEGAGQTGGLAPGTAAQKQRAGAAQGGFDSALRRAHGDDRSRITLPGQGMRPDPDVSQQDALRRKAEELVSIALVQPVLKQMRESNNAAEPFKPGAWEKQFAPLLDAQWAQSLVTSENWDLVDAVARGLLKNPNTAAGGAAAMGAGHVKDHEQNG